MVVCENSRATVAIFLALGAMDAWPVLVNARLSGQEIDQIRDHCGARTADLYGRSVCTRKKTRPASGCSRDGDSRYWAYWESSLCMKMFSPNLWKQIPPTVLAR